MEIESFPKVYGLLHEERKDRIGSTYHTAGYVLLTLQFLRFLSTDAEQKTEPREVLSAQFSLHLLHQVIKGRCANHSCCKQKRLDALCRYEHLLKKYLMSWSSG